MLSSDSWLAANPEKRAEYNKFIKSAQWKNMSKIVRDNAKHVCGHCKKPVATLEVHHLTYDRFGGKERLTDLIALCKECHANADEKRRAVQEANFEALCEERREDAAYHTYMTKVYGEDYTPCSDTHEEFMEWMQEKQERDDY